MGEAEDFSDMGEINNPAGAGVDVDRATAGLALLSLLLLFVSAFGVFVCVDVWIGSMYFDK